MFELLRKYQYYNVSEAIEIAKGKYELTADVKKIKKQIERRKRWQTKRR